MRALCAEEQTTYLDQFPFSKVFNVFQLDNCLLTYVLLYTFVENICI